MKLTKNSSYLFLESLLKYVNFFIDVSCQTSSKLSNSSPRKQGLKRKIKDLQIELKSSKKRKTVTRQDVEQFLDERYPQEATMLIKNQLTLLDKNPKGARYSKEVKHFALSLFLLGPKPYKKLSRVIRLPSPSTLRKLTEHWKITPGFNEFMFKILKLRVPLMSDKAKDCILCIDEMSIKSNLFYNVSRDVVVGFEDLQNKRSTNIATSVLVTMVRGISHNWKQPISYFFTKNSVNAEDLKEIIVETIRKLKGIGLNVLAVTSDQGPNFYKLVKNGLKLTLEKPYFVVDESNIFYLFDVPHLLKSTRNNFFSYNFCLVDGVTTKSYLEMMYTFDKVKQYRLAPRLSDEHLNPNNFKKMKVKLASQVFSHSVAVAMHTYIDFGKIPEEAKVTANFIEDMNKLFDIFNSSNLETCHAFMGTTEQFEFLKKMDTLFSNLKVLDKRGKNVTNSLKFIFGWRLTISSILNLWKMLKFKNYKFLLTRNLDQDCLENYFGQIRNACGNARNPTAIQFTRAFKKLLAIGYFHETEGSNCMEDSSDILLNITSESLKNIESFQEKKYENISPIIKIESTEYRNLISEEGNALVYVGGYFLRRCLFKHSCHTCLQYCSLSERDKSTSFCELKAYNDSKNIFGGLTVPPNDFSEYLIRLENIFVSNFNNYCIHDGVGNMFLKEYSNVEFTHPCSNFPKEYLLSLFTRVRIYYTIKFANRQIRFQCLNKQHPKLKILQNL